MTRTLESHARPVPVLNRDRGRWIAESAYYRAEKRGFAPGFALEDWLTAEAEVDFLIARARRRQKVVPLLARGQDPSAGSVLSHRPWD